MKNYYSILEISENASEEVIRAAYLALAKKYHPDNQNGDSEKMKEISEAYENLSDTNKRAIYDFAFKQGKNASQYSQQNPSGSTSGYQQSKPASDNESSKTRTYDTKKKGNSKSEENIQDRILLIFWYIIGGGFAVAIILKVIIDCVLR